MGMPLSGKEAQMQLRLRTCVVYWDSGDTGDTAPCPLQGIHHLDWETFRPMWAFDLVKHSSTLPSDVIRWRKMLLFTDESDFLNFYIDGFM